MASETYHEPYKALSSETKDQHRAIVSLMEELEAVDWYQQRAEACEDDELRAVLTHNKNEEIEHAMMVLEWLRRRAPVFNKFAKTYIFSKGPITEIEAEEKSGGHESGSAPANSSATGLGIGSLKGAR